MARAKVKSKSAKDVESMVSRMLVSANTNEYNRIVNITGRCRNVVVHQRPTREYEVLTQRGPCWIRRLPVVGEDI